MDRRKKVDLPKMQIGFIDFICIPLYQVIHTIHSYICCIAVSLPSVHAQQGVKQSCLSVCLSVCPWTKNIETAEIRSYSLRKGYYNNV